MSRLVTIFMALVFLTTAGFSQSLDEISDQVIELLNKREYEKAIPVIETAIGMASAKFGESHSSVLDLNYLLATCYRETGQYNMAELQYVKVIELQKRVLGEEHIDCINSMDELASVYASQLEYQKAETLFLQVIEVRKKIAGENNSYASCLSRLAKLYLTTRQYEKAEPLYRRVLDILKKIVGENHPDYATPLNNLGELYIETKKYNKAERLFIAANEIYRKSAGENHPNFATGLNNLGLLYIKMGQLVKAEPLLKKAKEIMLKALGEDDPEYVNILNTLGELYRHMGQYRKAELLYLHALGILIKIVGENDPDYANALNNLETLYRNMGLYKKAETLHSFSQTWNGLNDSLIHYSNNGEYEKGIIFGEKALLVVKNQFGKTYPDYATSLNNLAFLFMNMGQYEKAEPLFIEAEEINKKVLGETHPDYATSLNNLGGLYKDMGKYEKAEHLYIRAKEIRKKVLGVIHPDYASSLNNLGSLYDKLGQYEKAEPLCIESMAINKKILGETHPDYATGLNNLAALYDDMGQYEKAEPLYIQAKEIRKKALGETHPSYASSLNNLAALYNYTGQYEKAEPLYIESMAIRKKVLGETHPDYAVSLNNLGQLYEAMGLYEKAEPLCIQAVEINKKVLGESHPDYAASLNNLGEFYRFTGQYEKAEPLYIQAKEIRKNVLGETNPDYAESLNNLAALYDDMSQYEKAESMYIQAKEIYKKVPGETHPTYALSLNNLAVSLSKSGQDKKAEPLFLQAKEIWKKALGETHPDFATSLNNLGSFYEAMGKYEKAMLFILQNNQIVIKNMVKNFTILSEKEKGNYLSNNIWLLQTNNSFLYNFKKAPASIIQNNFNQQLVFKSITLAETRNVLTSIQQNPDTSVQLVLKNWQTDKKLLAKQYSLPVATRRADLKQLETRTENLEKELSRKSVEFRNQQKAIRISMRDLQKNLQQDESAIEFVSFRLYNRKWTDSIVYAAYILNKNDSVPVFVPLCEEKQLIKMLSPKSVSNESIKALYRSEIAGDEEQKIELGDSLYALIWKPLLPYLQGINKIDYSPAGLLYKVAFHALPAGDNQLLLDKYQLRQFTSLRQIVEVANQTNIAGSIALFGDCVFTMDSISMVKNIAAGKTGSTIYSSGLSRSGNHQAWANLPGTGKEIAAIQSLFEKNRFHSTSYTQQKATEEQFKSLSGNPPTVLHLATHGFFLPDPEKKKREGLQTDNRNAFTLADDPLLRSGIVLSGANRVWSGRPPIEGREDGIVTAYEISQLDLSKTHLVVLSACETALGDIKGNEGVFGLQRAFKLAGVKNMLLSLWRVPDAETAELMTTFYNYYIQGKPVREAFNAAQKDMRAKYKPYYWAAFVLIE